MSKIFISGPMTGISQYNKEHFDAVEVDLSLKGHTVLSPANTVPLHDPEQITHDQYLAICFAMIDCCDTVYFLKGWEKSIGANREMKYAVEHHKTVEFEVR